MFVIKVKQMKQNDTLAMVKAQLADIDIIEGIYKRIVANMLDLNIVQWSALYPTRRVFQEALEHGELFVYTLSGCIAGAVILNSTQIQLYAQVPWLYNDAPFLVVHTLGIEPGLQGQGYGRKAMERIEEYAAENGYKTIRLDTYSGNKPANSLYEACGYRLAGTVLFNHRPEGHRVYNCYEKSVNTVAQEKLTHATAAALRVFSGSGSCIPALEALKRSPDSRVYVKGNSAILHDSKSGTAYAYSQDERELLSLRDALAKEVNVILLLNSALMQVFTVNWRPVERAKEFYQYYCPPDGPAYETKGIDVRPIGAEYTDFVCAHYDYRALAVPDYIGPRLEEGPAFGVFVKEEIAGFILTHDEGSIGMLHVLPQHRRKGFGEALLAAIAARLIETGRVPYCHIALDNEASLNMHKKLGFLPTHPGTVCWVILRD